MNIADLKGKKITVMGLGLHGGGVSTVRFLVEAGARVTVTDIRSKEELMPSLEKIKKLKGVRYVFSAHRPEDFTSVDMVIKNPAAPWNNIYIKMALEHKVPVEMDSSLFFKLCKNKIIGVTGTKGKTTTATLIYEILKGAGKDVLKVGIGQVPVLDKLKELKKDTIVVFELSSWRLSSLSRDKVSPQIAVLTNIYPDHLNYYKTMESYIKDKMLICQNQKAKDICILNADDEILAGWEGKIKSKVVKVSNREDMPGAGVYIKDEAICMENENGVQKLMDIKDVKLKGAHNLGNVMLAAAASGALGISPVQIKKSISLFQGVAHRLELVRELGGVKYVNDTAATTPESARSGLDAFAEPVILICGGSDKNLEMEQFGARIAEKAKGAIFLKGKATEKLIAAIKNHDGLANDDFKVVESMDKAVELASREAEPGDVVLLSPGAASFGLFQNEFDRGDKFKEAVKKLK